MLRWIVLGFWWLIWGQPRSREQREEDIPVAELTGCKGDAFRSGQVAFQPYLNPDGLGGFRAKFKTYRSFQWRDKATARTETRSVEDFGFEDFDDLEKCV